jgi:ankyrin repeat protein
MQVSHFAVLFFLLSSSVSALTIGEALNEKPPKLATLKLAIQCDKNPDFINENGESYLHIAAKRDLPKSVELLMQIPQVSALYLHRNNLGHTAIEVAITLNNQRAFNELAKSLRVFNDFRIEKQHHGSLLHLAAALNRASMMKPLIKAGIPVNLEDERGLSALDVARDEGSKAAEKVLIDNEAVSTKDTLEEIIMPIESSEDDDDEADTEANNDQDGLEIDDGGVCSGTNAFLSMCIVGGACCALPTICQVVSSLSIPGLLLR